jgi:hypothetical protein
MNRPTGAVTFLVTDIEQSTPGGAERRHVTALAAEAVQVEGVGRAKPVYSVNRFRKTEANGANGRTTTFLRE